MVESSHRQSQNGVPGQRAIYAWAAASSLFLAGTPGFLLLYVYAFSTMVDPRLPDDERTRIIVNNFLFQDGAGFLFVSFLFFAFFSLLASFALNVSWAISGPPKARLNLLKVSCLAGGVTTIIVIGITFWFSR